MVGIGIRGHEASGSLYGSFRSIGLSRRSWAQESLQKLKAVLDERVHDHTTELQKFVIMIAKPFAYFRIEKDHQKTMGPITECRYEQVVYDLLIKELKS